MKKYCQIGLSAGLLLLSSDLWATCNNLTKINWLLGEWQANKSQSLQTEVWQKLDDKNLTGYGTVINKQNNKPPFIETLRLIEMADEVFYVAKTPQNDLPVAFKLVECSENSAQFVNPSHDFPNSLHYKKLDKRRLLVEVRANNGDGFDINFLARDQQASDNLSKVQEYVKAYNVADIKSMELLMADDIAWMSVVNSQISVETKNKKQLVKAMLEYFQSGATQSEIVESHTIGDFISVIEKASWINKGENQSQCSPALYEFQSGLIKNVWYFSASACD